IELVVESTSQILDAGHASLRLLDPSRRRLVAACRSAGSPRTAPMEFRRGEGLLGWIVDERQPLRLDDPQHDPRFVRAAESTATIRSFVGAPLVTGQQCFGVLSAVEPTRSFSGDDLRMLQLIAAICAPNLEI